ncbi:hypothetical protein [Chroococcidiopsis cubana]|nr:hypothetical protein [Chroococcidiopsis cubana]
MTQKIYPTVELLTSSLRKTVQIRFHKNSSCSLSMLDERVSAIA